MTYLTELGEEIGKSVYKQLVINPKYDGLSYDDLETILLNALNKSHELLMRDKAADRDKGNQV